jgi:hypothetical protein
LPGSNGADFDLYDHQAVYSPPGGRDPHRGTIRASDADREAAAAELRRHYATGRLDSDELSERLSAAYAARTHGSLDKLFVDLPAVPPPAPAPYVGVGVPRRCGRRSCLPALLAVGIFWGAASESHRVVDPLLVAFLVFVTICCLVPLVLVRWLRSTRAIQAFHEAGRHWSSHYRSRW